MGTGEVARQALDVRERQTFSPVHELSAVKTSLGVAPKELWISCYTVLM